MMESFYIYIIFAFKSDIKKKYESFIYYLIHAITTKSIYIQLKMIFFSYILKGYVFKYVANKNTFVKVGYLKKNIKIFTVVVT